MSVFCTFGVLMPLGGEVRPATRAGTLSVLLSFEAPLVSRSLRAKPISSLGPSSLPSGPAPYRRLPPPLGNPPALDEGGPELSCFTNVNVESIMRAVGFKVGDADDGDDDNDDPRPGPPGKDTHSREPFFRAGGDGLLLSLFLHIKSHPDLSAQYPLLSVPINTTSRYSQFPCSQENLHYKIKLKQKRIVCAWFLCFR